MKNVKVQAALRELAEEVKKIVNERIKQYGANQRAHGENTLEGSNLQRSLGVYPTENGIELQIADYWEYVALGWHRTHRFEGTMAQFIRNINDWVIRKGIRLGNYTQAQMVFLITRKIMEEGIQARPFMVWNEEGDLEKMIPELNNMLDEWFDKLIDAILNDIDNFFK